MASGSLQPQPEHENFQKEKRMGPAFLDLLKLGFFKLWKNETDQEYSTGIPEVSSSSHYS